MSTIIIITPPKKPNAANRVLETPDGADIVNAEGQSVATFTGPEAYDQAIRYLKVMKD